MKVALITGVSRKEGLGYATAQQLGLLGFQVVIAARHLDQAESLAQDLHQQGLQVSAIHLDLVNRESITQAANYVAETFHKLDVLINNAALMLNATATIAQKDMDELTEEFATNITGTWSVSQQFLPLLVASGHGRIVNISSSMSLFSEPGFGLIDYNLRSIPAYTLTKLALNGLTIKMAKDLQADHILVNAVCPGFTATRPGMAEYGARPVSESVAGIVWAATLPDDGPTGQFFRDQQLQSW